MARARERAGRSLSLIDGATGGISTVDFIVDCVVKCYYMSRDYDMLQQMSIAL